jgi:glycine oxidase
MNSIIIVGGGIMGLLCAYELDKAGHDVTLIDRQQLGQESSWAGGGIISPLYPWRYPEPVTRLANLSQKLYPELIDHLQQVSGKDAEFLASGMLILGDYSNENPQQWSARYNVKMQSVNADQLQNLAPEVSDQYKEGFWFPEVHQVRNPRLVSVLKNYLQKTRVNIIENSPVTGLISDHKRVTGVYMESSTLSADMIVITGGAWTSELLRPTGLETGIKPIKGQMLLLKGPAQAVKHITLSEDRYIIPRKDGHILIGSTNEDCGFNKDTTKQVRDDLLHYAFRTIPILRNFEINHHWSGLRPGSEDGIPVIGQHPRLDNLFINSGHYRNGLVMAPASARLLTEIMLKRPTCLPKIDYAPCDRFHNKN